ncbi:flagellar biosynthetic protein FliO [Mobilicoccus pelagius]|uniref:Flagellar protein n=1 Tax=Mobilicoccus pelagius NBRC 104925 TaxID=1089455 RepID=H5UQZ0_9MICO|nr:flagellar biosynthetic protein FliO [Mobilicoccus pelagius]GAB48148.1 hypothetical protein MOPEL_060_00650 [Mobilicoccus pelagius NBRC 104925]
MNDSSLAFSLARAAISLALVLGLLVLCLRTLARRGGFTAPTRASVDLEVLGRRQLSRAASVQVVRVGEDLLVLGVTDSHVSTLHHLSTGDLPADEEEGEPTTSPSTGTTPSATIDALRRQGRLGRLVADATGTRSRSGRHRGRPDGTSRSGRTRATSTTHTTAPADVLGTTGPITTTTVATTGAGGHVGSTVGTLGAAPAGTPSTDTTTDTSTIATSTTGTSITGTSITGRSITGTTDPILGLTGHRHGQTGGTHA